MVEKHLKANFILALSQIENPPLNGRANYGKYALLVDCLRVAKSALTPHGFAVMQLVHSDPDRLVTRILHSSGESIEDGGVPLYCENKSNPQKLSSCITYAKRVGLCALLGIVGSEDDDGLGATPKSEHPKPKPQIQPITKTKSEVKNWETWVTEQLNGMPKHKDMAMHKLWSTSCSAEREQLKNEDPTQFERLANGYKARSNELTNNGGYNAA